MKPLLIRVLLMIVNACYSNYCGVIVVVVVAAVVVVVAAAATDHRRQCSCSNQARGANSRGSQQAPFLKRKGCPTD